MKTLNFILASFLLARHHVYAASCQGQIIAVTQQDLDAIQTCRTYNGDIIIDNSGATDLRMDGVELLEGDITVSNNDALKSLSFPRLQSINGKLRLNNNIMLSKLDFKELIAIRNIEISTLPGLVDLNFPSGLSQVDQLTIADTTLTKLDGLKMGSVKDIRITNNIYLKNINFVNMTSIGSVLISANSPSLFIEMNQVENIREATFRNVAKMSLGQLKKVSGDLIFISNLFDSLELPTTTEIVGTLTLTDNLQLNNLSLPKLKHLGGALALTGNSKLSIIDAFKQLEQVDGALDITGDFDEIHFPVLNDVRGSFNVQTSSSFFSCDTMNDLKNGVIKGNSFVCKAATSQPKSMRGDKKGATGSHVGSGSSESSATDLFITARYIHSLYSLLISLILLNYI